MITVYLKNNESNAITILFTIVATMSKPRSIWGMIANNFLRSFKPRQVRGNFMGEDYFGNKYYEIPPNPSVGQRKPSRWFVPVNKDDFEQEKTAEWESWLRGRRLEIYYLSF